MLAHTYPSKTALPALLLRPVNSLFTSDEFGEQIMPRKVLELDSPVLYNVPPRDVKRNVG